MKESPNWFESHPALTIIAHTIIVATAVGSFAKFVLIDNIQIEYNAQLDSKEAIISEGEAIIRQKDSLIQQYEARITFLETENGRLHDDVNRYQEWLQHSPGTLQYIEHENEELKKQLENKTDHTSASLSTPDQKYSKSYELIKESTAIIDEYTGIIVAVNDISVTYEATLSLTAPGTDTEIIRYATAGLTREYVVDGKTYQVTLMMLDYVSDTYSISIRQL